MYSHHPIVVMVITIATALILYPGGLLSPAAGDAAFEENYAIMYGNDHVKFLDSERTQLQLSLDTKSGSGFGSKVKYQSGYFSMWIKLTNKDTAGVITAFYLRSGNNRVDEIDLEFLGNKEGKDITIQTNIFANGVGNREQRIVLPYKLWDDYHRYDIIWNPHIIIIIVDGFPIRVYKNNTAIGVGFPSQPMQILATIWNGDYWATDGGRTKINWGHAPFTAQFSGFGVDGCAAGADCGSTNYWWNRREYWDLTEGGKFWYESIREHFTYDYCTDTKRYPVPPPECATNSFL